MSTEIFSFDLKVRTQSVNVTDPEGQKKVYTISELSGEDMEKYMEGMQDKIDTTVDEKGGVKTTLKTFKGMFATLLSLCLRDETGTLVPFTTIQKFPTGVQKGMFEIAQSLNGLNEKGTAAGKN